MTLNYMVYWYDNLKYRTGFGKVIIINHKKGRIHFRENIIPMMKNVRNSQDYMDYKGDGCGYYINTEEDWIKIRGLSYFLDFELKEKPPERHQKLGGK